jgi:hypothetical protein
MGKRLRITEDNLKLIQAEIDKVEGKAYTNCLSAKSLLKVGATVEKSFRNPSKARLNGCVVLVQASGAHYANAYKYVPMETVVLIKHDTVGWYFDSVRRDPVRSHNWQLEVLPTHDMEEHLLLSACCLPLAM